MLKYSLHELLITLHELLCTTYLKMIHPLIFDIKRYSINDGPGIRTTIFFKGCPLRCAWCHNPESQEATIQKLYSAQKCIGAMDCIEVCPTHSLSMTREGIVTDTNRCNLCGKCAEACPSRAIEMSGRAYRPDEIMAILERERVQFDHSGGGVTFSGGEPLMFPRFLTLLLKECGEKQIHRAVDTCGFVATQTILNAAQHTDLFLYDLKHMDDSAHIKYTGVSNTLILNNLKEISALGANINIRIPFIKNVNADKKSIVDFAEFITSLPGKMPMVNLLPYHGIASGKYKKLGLIYGEGLMEEPSKNELSLALDIFRHYGLETEVGG